MEKRLSKEFFVSANEANAQGVLGVPVLVTNIIDISTQHANALHIGNPDMLDTGGGWVLSRLTIEMKQWPEVNTSYRLNTWVESWNRRFSERSYSIEAPDGTVLGYARSIWMVIDTSTHANLGLSHLSLADELIEGTEVPIERQARHCPLIPEGEDHSQRHWLPATEPVRRYRFKYCDIDYYRHVNTVRYVMLLLNQFTLNEIDEHPVERLELSFMHEAKYDMTVDILCHRDDNTYTFTLSEKDAHQSPLLFARIRLK